MPRIIRAGQPPGPPDKSVPDRPRHAPRPTSERLGDGNHQPVLVIGNTVGDGRARLRQAMLDARVAVELSMVHWGYRGRGELQAIANRRHFARVVLIERGHTGDHALELVQWAATRPRFKTIWVIVFTSYAMPGEEKRLRDAGAADYWVERYHDGPEVYAKMMGRLHYYMRPRSSSATLPFGAPEG